MPRRNIVLILGDFNAKVGQKKADDEYSGVAGKYGLGLRNDRAERMLLSCVERKLTVTNTWFQQPKRRLCTWKSCDGITRNRIHYILVNKHWKSSITSVRTLPGADVGTDHQLLCAKFRVRLRKLKNGNTNKRIYLSDEEKREFAQKVSLKSMKDEPTQV